MSRQIGPTVANYLQWDNGGPWDASATPATVLYYYKRLSVPATDGHPLQFNNPGTNNDSLRCRYSAAKNFQARVGNQTSAVSGLFDDNNWHGVANRAGSPSVIKVDVDDTLNPSVGGGNSTLNGTIHLLTLGNEWGNNSPAEPCDGLISRVAIFKGALTEAELDDYFSGTEPSVMDLSGSGSTLWRYWSLDDASLTDSVVGAVLTENGSCPFNADNPFGAAGPTAPTFTGPDIQNQEDPEDSPIAELPVAGSFNDGGGVYSPGYVGTSLPAGLSIDALTGVITGTPTSPLAGTGYTVTLVTDQGQIASNPFNWTIQSAAPGVVVYTVAADKPAGADSILDSSGAGIGNDVEVPTQTDQGDAITWYEPFDGTFLINNATGQKTFTARSRVDSGSAWTPAATFTITPGP